MGFSQELGNKSPNKLEHLSRNDGMMGYQPQPPLEAGFFKESGAVRSLGDRDFFHPGIV